MVAIIYYLFHICLLKDFFGLAVLGCGLNLVLDLYIAYLSEKVIKNEFLKTGNLFQI